MQHMVYSGWIVSIRAVHYFDEEIATRVFAGVNAYQKASDWAKQEIEYLVDYHAASDPANADIHEFRANLCKIEIEIDL